MKRALKKSNKFGNKFRWRLTKLHFRARHLVMSRSHKAQDIPPQPKKKIKKLEIHKVIPALPKPVGALLY